MTAFWRDLPSLIDPVLLKLWGFEIRWYGLMYLAALGTTYCLALYRARKEDRFPFDREFLKDLMTWAFVGLLLGGRLGYVLFYNFSYFAKHPAEIILPFRWDDGFQFTGISGMSFHGGLAGAVFACLWFCHKRKADFLQVADLYSPIFPLGYTFGRLGNFINGELYGRVTDSAWGMQFPAAPTAALRWPSQLFEAFFEGIVLFVVLWSLRRLRLPKGFFLAAFLAGYGIIRFYLEYFRQPDEHLGLVMGNLSMGQVLCLLMILGGGFLALALYRSPSRGGTGYGPAPGK